MSDQKVHAGIIIILCLVVIRGLIYGLFIPFDQTPDENHHFKLIKAKHLQLNHASEEERRSAAAQEMLTWCYLTYPESCPEKSSLEDFAGSTLPLPPPSRQIYYLFTGWILKILSLENMRDEVYVMRGVSILCGTLVVFLSFLVAREIFPENRFLILGVPVFITFVPQFSAMNGSINNDKLVEIFAALLFWVMVRIFKHGMTGRYFLAYTVTMGLTLLSKRTGVFTVPLVLVFLVVYYWKTSLGIRMHVVLTGIFIGIIIGGYYLIMWNGLVNELIDENIISIPAPGNIKYLLLRPDLYTIQSLKYYAKFFIMMYWSFWGVFGYMTIHLHHFWYVVAALAQFLSIGGLLNFTLQIKMKKLSVERWKAKVLYLFAASIILIIMIPFTRSILFRFKDPSLTQGRYLFTVIIPISMLTVFGVASLFHRKYHRLIGAIAIIGLIILDVVCLSNYILLNFHARSLF